MPRRNQPEKGSGSRNRGRGYPMERRSPRPRPKTDFTIDAISYKNPHLLKQFVTDQGRILPRKYTGLPAHYQRRVTRAIK